MFLSVALTALILLGWRGTSIKLGLETTQVITLARKFRPPGRQPPVGAHLTTRGGDGGVPSQKNAIIGDGRGQGVDDVMAEYAPLVR